MPITRFKTHAFTNTGVIRIILAATLSILSLIFIFITSRYTSIYLPTTQNQQQDFTITASSKPNPTLAINTNLFQHNRPPLCSPTPLPPLPLPNTSISNDQPHMPAYYSIYACHALGLAYIHIFKSGGSALASNLGDFCHATTGQRSILYTSWDDQKKNRLSALVDLCGSGHWLCYSFYREPVSRFLSGYHEVMKRRHESDLYKHAKPAANLTEDASIHQKLQLLEAMITEREIQISDPHLDTQLRFLRRRNGGNQLATSSIAFFDIENADLVLKKLYCGSYFTCLLQSPPTTTNVNGDGSGSQVGRRRRRQLMTALTSGTTLTHRDILGTAASSITTTSINSKTYKDTTTAVLSETNTAWLHCPIKPLPIARARSSKGYGLPQYNLTVEDLNDDLIARIAGIYNVDYCYFGIEKHPRALTAPKCLE